MLTYRITYLIGKLDASTCPPAFLPVIFPAFNGEPVTLCEQYCDVTFSEPQTPVSISPLIKVELLQD
jgi:hypothetical protein